MSGSQFTRKLGPLPVWAWAALVLVAYYAYNHYKNSTSTPPSTGSSADGSNPVPGFDAASGGAGSSYSTPPGGAITNIYYGDLAAAQASGGGTSSTLNWSRFLSLASGIPSNVSLNRVRVLSGSLSGGGTGTSGGGGGGGTVKAM